MLNFFGLTPKEERDLRRYVPTIKDYDEPVWVVSVSAADRFNNLASLQDAQQTEPKAVLWVPSGKAKLDFVDWSESEIFHAQLREDSEEDRAFLERLARCPQVLEWGVRAADVPANWFTSLTEKPRYTATDKLPFTDAHKEHLRKCEDCVAEAYRRLDMEVDVHQMLTGTQPKFRPKTPRPS
jgi:hypothetical protein